MIIQPVLSHKHVQIVDEAPVIVPFGPIYTGKTMMLYRLFRFLLVRGYCVCENVIFVEPSLMSAYEELMRKFFERLNKNNIAVATTQLPLLFDVYCEGKSICHILDQTGTSHFDKDNIENPAFCQVRSATFPSSSVFGA